MAVLSIDFEKAYRQARTLAGSGEEMLQLAGRLNDIASEVRRSWRGETAAAYLRKIESFDKVLRAGAGKCRDDAAAFRAKIDAIKAAEEAARLAMEEEKNARV